MKAFKTIYLRIRLTIYFFLLLSINLFASVQMEYPGYFIKDDKLPGNTIQKY